MNFRRQSGILLHPTSLPGLGGIGTFGATARQFVDFLHAAGQSLWQVLPLGPTGYGNCPYSCYSAFAGNPLLINLDELVSEGDLDTDDLREGLPDDHVDYDAVVAVKIPLLKKAARRFLDGDGTDRKREFWHFCDTTSWLHDYALFIACKAHFHGRSWNNWPHDIAGRKVAAYEQYSKRLGDLIGEQKYIQWQFSRQWGRLRSYANSRGVQIVGDAPIFVAYDSADVWCNRHLFLLDDHGKPLVVAGVPPDYFSKTGQLWGNPLYNWGRMAEDGYGWWISRLGNDLCLYDMVRIDHFRGFEACWTVKYGQKTAMKGEWVKSPGDALLATIRGAFSSLPIIAEDLGIITHEVEALRDRFSLPGMKILQFAFEGGAGNPYLPHNYTQNSVVYTGTHDNDTTRGWFAGLSAAQRKRILGYLRCREDELVKEMIRAAISSTARMSIMPLQDLIGLGSDARMNVPGVAHGNWTWRFKDAWLDDGKTMWLKEITEYYNRSSR